MIDNENDLYLLIDIDDLLVRSSGLLQKTVNDNTNFKTEVLNMLEQLKRNCQYVVDEVTNECVRAMAKDEVPNLSRFKIFGDKIEKNYSTYIDSAQYYYQVADKLYNQFLEERDTFLEIDNMEKGKRKYFNYERELAAISQIAEFIINNKEAFHKINEFCLEEMKRLINDAKKQNDENNLTIPNYGALVKMDNNDIIKENSVNVKDSKEKVLYDTPLQKVVDCLKNENKMVDIITNSRVFYRESEEIVDYSKIHSLENVNWDAVNLIKLLLASGKFKGAAFATHHNGEREEKDKIKLMKVILPEVKGFVGQRFHDFEHDAGRRGRSSKSDKARDRLHIDPKRVVLIDDSLANCADCKGIAILYRPKTDAEIINNKVQETGYVRIFDFGKDAYDTIMEAIEKQKVKRK